MMFRAALQMPLSRGIANSMMFGSAIANAAQPGQVKIIIWY